MANEPNTTIDEGRSGPPTPKSEESEISPYYAAEVRLALARTAYRVANNPTASQQEELDSALHEMMTTEAPAMWAVFKKLAIVEELIVEVFEVGVPTYPNLLIYTAAIKADILAIEEDRMSKANREAGL